MSAEQVVDLAVDPLEERRRRRQMLLRVGLPVGGVALMIMAILAIDLYSDRANRAGATALADNVLSGLQARISQQVAAYLDPAARATLLVRDVLGQQAGGDRREAAQAFATAALNHIPQLDAFYFADRAGNFTMLRRGSNGGSDLKIIRNGPGGRVVTLVHRDAAGREIGRDVDPADTYDPRTRAWFRAALASNDVQWSNVYVFYSSHAPGITASVRYQDPAGQDVLFGVDITLADLSRFLASLRIGRSGRAVIIDGDGRVVAMPDVTHGLREQDGTSVEARVDEVGDPELTAAYDRFRVKGDGRRVIDVGGTPVVSIVSRLPLNGRDWSVMIVVPERDFTGFVSSNSRRGLVMSLAVVAIAALLAALLVRQGLRADRAARLVLERSRAITRQSAAFGRLAAEPGLFDPGEHGLPPVVLETLADIADARRGSVWRMVGEQTLRCEDSFERESGGHVDGLELSSAELPQFFAFLRTGETLAVPDAAADPRTAELHRLLMHRSGSVALAVVPIRRLQRVAGAVWLEDAASMADAGDFVQAVANMLAIRLTAAADTAPRSEARANAPAALAAPEHAGERSFAAELLLRDLDPQALAAEVYPSVAALALHFVDQKSMAVRHTANGGVLADEIAGLLQDVAARHSIPYLKLVGQNVVAAAGCDASDTNALLRLADAALEIRERCTALFEAADLPAAFRIGLDYGIAIGSSVGRAPRLFNLWGEAFRSADEMAASGMLGSIQVTEAAFRRLRREFLFRQRGSFYLPRIGAAQTFILAGRI